MPLWWIELRKITTLFVLPVYTALPPGAVLKRLGRSGIRVAGLDLADALQPAYEAFAATRDDAA